MKKLIFSLFVAASVSLTPVSAQWVIRENITQLPSGVNEININGNKVSTAINTHAISMAEDIYRRYEGPTYIYDGEKLIDKATLPTPAPQATAPAPSATPKPLEWEVAEEIEGTGYQIRRRGNKEYRITDKQGNVVLDTYSYFYSGKGRRGETLVVAQKDGKSVLLDSNLKVVADNDYTGISLNGGFIRVRRDYDYTYLDKNYKEIIGMDGEYGFSYIQNEKLRSDSRFLIVQKGYKDALMDENGNISSDWYSQIMVEGNGYEAYTGSGYVAIQADGTLLSDKEYTSVYQNAQGEWFCRGSNPTSVEKYDANGNLLWSVEGYIDYVDKVFGDLYVVEKDNGAAFMDADGNLLTDFVYGDIVDDVVLSDGITETPCCRVSIGGEVRFVDRSFNIYDTEKGIYYAKSGWYAHHGHDFGDTRIAFIQWDYALIDNRTNSYIIPYGDAVLSASGNYILRTQDEKTTVMDIYGNTLYEFDEELSAFNDFGDGLILVTDAMNKKYVIDADGENIFGKKFDYISRFADNKFLAQSGNELIVIEKSEYPVAVHTDIRTMINGFEIPCYSADNRNVIVAEDLGGYGFDIAWDGEKQTLNITRNPEYYEVNPVDLPAKQAAWDYYADIVPTDIKVYFNGKRIGAYSIGGRMLIAPEDLVTDGISYMYNNDERILHMQVDGLEQGTAN